MESIVTDVRKGITKCRMLTGTYLLLSYRYKFSSEVGSPTCRICGLENEDITHMLLQCSSLVAQRRQLYSNVKSLVIEDIGLNQWMKIFNNTENITQLILDCNKFVHTIRESILMKLTKATTDLCYRLHIVRLDKSD